MDRPTHPCAFCGSATFLYVPNASIEVATSGPMPDRYMGEALLCRGCGHVAYFISDVRALEEAPGATSVTLEDTSPYRS